MLDLALLQVFNHLLDAAPWARARLAPFAGRRARLALGAWPLDFRIAADGSLESLGTEAPAVTITLPVSAPLGLPGGREALLREARIEGAADFAEALGSVLRRLEWDAEEDLARIVGDIAAHRLARLARGFLTQQAASARRLAENIDEYLRYERPAGAASGNVT